MSRSPAPRRSRCASSTRSSPSCGSRDSSSAASGRTAATGSPGPPDELTLAEIVSELDGPLASLRGEPPEQLSFRGDAQPLREVWIALGANMRQVLDSVTIADLVSGQLPELVRTIASRPDVGQIDTHLDTSGG